MSKGSESSGNCQRPGAFHTQVTAMQPLLGDSSQQRLPSAIPQVQHRTADLVSGQFLPDSCLHHQIFHHSQPPPQDGGKGESSPGERSWTELVACEEVVNGSLFQCTLVKSGVLQSGSILGPVLFNSFISNNYRRVRVHPQQICQWHHTQCCGWHTWRTRCHPHGSWQVWQVGHMGISPHLARPSARCCI